jgi:hypothetical protein
MYVRLFCLLLFLWMPTSTFAQKVESSSSDGVVFHADPRLAILFAKKQEGGYHGLKGSIRSAQGFRVQIYSGTDRAAATQRKIDFIRRYPNIRSYLSYVAPTFRVKVGDFKTRAEAYKLLQQLSAYYSLCMVVPDIVEINSLRDED